MKTDEATLAAAVPEGPDPDAVRKSKRTVIVVLLFMGILGSLWVVGPFIFEGRDDPTAIDSKAVRPTVSQSCRDLRTALAAIPAGLAAPEKAETENRTVEQFVARIRALGPDKLNKDEPVNRWLADWEKIIATRREAVRSGKRFAMPFEDNAPVNVRMFALVRSGLEHCDVPPALLAAEPGTV